ncbi:600_t:CDS:2 [Rhizophagus irregularis]|nr:600_t:CDS:2 [Rhizophagus irregularis]
MVEEKRTEKICDAASYSKPTVTTLKTPIIAYTYLTVHIQLKTSVFILKRTTRP